MRPRAIGSVVVATGIALVACGGEPRPAAPSQTLDPVNRLAILEQVVATVVGGVGTPGGSGVATRSNEDPSSPPLGHLASSGPGPFSDVSCEKSCDDTTCVVTCPVEERLRCPAGGAATNSGTIAGTLDASETGTATLRTRQTYLACRPRADLEVDGDPETTASGVARFERGALADDQSVRIRGAVRYASADGSGRCEVDLDVSVSGRLHGSAHGTACGQPVDVTF